MGKKTKKFFFLIKTSRVAFAVLDRIEDSFIRSKRPQGMLNSLFKKQHERNARLPDGELERRRREAQRVRERDRKQAEYRAHQEEGLGGDLVPSRIV